MGQAWRRLTLAVRVSVAISVCTNGAYGTGLAVAALAGSCCRTNIRAAEAESSARANVAGLSTGAKSTAVSAVALAPSELSSRGTPGQLACKNMTNAAARALPTSYSIFWQMGICLLPTPSALQFTRPIERGCYRRRPLSYCNGVAKSHPCTSLGSYWTAGSRTQRTGKSLQTLQPPSAHEGRLFTSSRSAASRYVPLGSLTTAARLSPARHWGTC